MNANERECGAPDYPSDFYPRHDCRGLPFIDIHKPRQ